MRHLHCHAKPRSPCCSSFYLRTASLRPELSHPSRTLLAIELVTLGYRSFGRVSIFIFGREISGAWILVQWNLDRCAEWDRKCVQILRFKRNPRFYACIRWSLPRVAIVQRTKFSCNDRVCKLQRSRFHSTIKNSCFLKAIPIAISIHRYSVLTEAVFKVTFNVAIESFRLKQEE